MQHGASLRQFRAMWGRDRDRYVLCGRVRRRGEPMSYTILERGDRPSLIVIDEDDALASEVIRRMLAAGVPVISDIREGQDKGYFSPV